MMTPEQRLDRVERILTLFVNAGRRVRGEYRHQSREHDEKINILIQTQMDTEEIMKRLAVSQAETEATMKHLAVSQAETEATMKHLAVSQAETEATMKRLAASQAELSESQKLTDQALRRFIDGLHEGRNGKSSK